MTEKHILQMPHMKTSVVSKTVNVPDDLLEGVIEFAEEVQSSELEIVFSQRIERFHWVLENNE
jgi:hypothetical protein